MFFELFSEREKARLKAGQEDIFQYKDFPPAFRAQVIHLLGEVIGDWNRSFDNESNRVWRSILQVYTREMGVFYLKDRNADPQNQCCNFMLDCKPGELVDFIDLAFHAIVANYNPSPSYYGAYDTPRSLENIIEELNIRFRKHNIGYEFSGGEIVRVDSKFLHSEAVRPAIQLLYGAGSKFAGPLQEFMDAHRKYREGEYKDAVMGAAKSFESVMKSICTVRGWAFDAHKDTASKLIKIVMDNGLIPAYLQTQFASLSNVMESGVATIRNKTAGHGQGSEIQNVPEHLISYVLHLTASNIVFLLESHNRTQ